MTVFCSRREKRLWLWTLAVVAAIYATLGLAGLLAPALGDTGLPEALFLSGAVLVGAAIVVHGVRARPGRAEIVVAVGVAAVYVLLLTRIGSAAERTHLIEYGVVAVLIHEALVERARQGRPVPTPALLAILAAAALGLLDECLQAFLPSRVFDPLDLLVNLIAATMAVVASSALAWVRRRSRG